MLCSLMCFLVVIFFFKQKTAYEIKECDWSSDVCSSDLWKRLQATRSDANPRRATSIAAALELCRQVLPRRAVLFLISDFLDDGYLQVLRHANRKHDVVAALITDPREADMPPAGLVTLEDAESGRTRLVDTRSAEFRKELAARAEQRRTKLKDDLRATGMDLVVFDASQSMVDP